MNIRVATDPPYDVHVGAGLLASVAEDAALSTPRPRLAVVADSRVAKLYRAALVDIGDCPCFEHSPGERAKSFEVLEGLLDFLAEADLDRRSLIVTLGGGVTSDLGGLAASLFKRGIGVVHCPTTLLAQVDASVGGKTAVNLASGKNLAGTFHQPRAVYADTSTLRTLATDEFASGLGEVLKTALIGGEELLRTLEVNAGAILDRDAGALTEIIAECVRVKAGIVASDPTEAGPRRALNLGHTFAHGIEHAAGYGTVPHGVAVAVGIALALQAARELGTLTDAALTERYLALAKRLELPTRLAELGEKYATTLTSEAVARGMRHDKKGAAGQAQLVLPKSAGELELGVGAAPEFLVAICAKG